MLSTTNCLFDILDFTVRPQNKPNVFACKRQGEWLTFSAENILQQIDAVSLGLIGLGVQIGDRIAIVSDGRPEWNILDFALQQIGAVFSANSSTSSLLHLPSRKCLRLMP